MEGFALALAIIGALTVSVYIMRFIDLLEKGGRRGKRRGAR